MSNALKLEAVLHQPLLDYNQIQTLPYVFEKSKDSKKLTLYLGAKKVATTHGHKIQPVDIRLRDKLSFTYDGDIVFLGNFQGPGEITATGNIYGKGNISGGVADSDMPLAHRFALAAPSGKIEIGGEGKSKLQKADLTAKRIISNNCDMESVVLTTTEKEPQEKFSILCKPKPPQHRLVSARPYNPTPNRFWNVTTYSDGNVMLPDCYECRINAKEAVLHNADEATLKFLTAHSIPHTTSGTWMQHVAEGNHHVLGR